MRCVYTCNLDDFSDADILPAHQNLRRQSTFSRYLLFFALIYGKNGEFKNISRCEIMRSMEKIKDMMHEFGWEKSKHGKPFPRGLALDENCRYFSLSHSKNIAAVCVSDENIGIDVQAIDEHTDIKRLLKIAERVRSDEEHIADFSRKQFYRWWTGKEAACKLDGRGISVLSQIKIQHDSFKIQQKSGFLQSRFIDINDQKAWLTTAWYQ